MNAQLATTNPFTRWLTIALHLSIVLALLAGLAAWQRADTTLDRVDEQQTLVIGQTRFAPGSEASLRVLVRDLESSKPIADAQVKVSLKPDRGKTMRLFEGRTDENGSLPAHFYVPADAPEQATLVVESKSSVGRDRVEQAVSVQREYRLLLSSDKPLYQPGQVIHMRALALSAFDLSPARGATVDFLVQDAKGNKVFRQSVTASDFGVAAADFTLADMVNQGNYKLSVSIGDTQSEKTVEVRPYVLPKFGVNISTERSFYLPGQHVEGTVQADYFFGKPVADGEVQLVGSVWDVGRTVMMEMHGQTDEDGSFSFAFDLPEYFAGPGLESGQTQFALEVTVIDQAEHAEQTSHVLPIAAQPLIIEAVAESGTLKPGVENIIYVLTSYPDGRPAPTRLQISVDHGPVSELSSGEFGLAEFTFAPSRAGHHVLDITAQDESGASARQQVAFNSERGNDSVLLRADRAAYVVGETMTLVAFTPVASGEVYLDIVKAGQTLSTRSAPVVEGKAEFTVDVSPDLFGTLELHAYKVLLDGSLVRDTRLVVVDASNDLSVSAAADKDTYLPGETATVNLQSDDGQGAGVQTALGVAIVDESVFALQRQDPGFAKLYFLLEQELLEPFYQVKGFELPAAIPPDQAQVRAAQDEAAKATWADAPTSSPALATVTRQEKMASAYEAQERGFERIAQGATLGMILVPLLLWIVALVALWRAQVLRQSLKRLVVVSGVLLLLGGGLFSGLGEDALDAVLSVPSTLVFGLGLLAFLAYAWLKRDLAAQFFVLLTLAWGAALLFLSQAADRGGEPSDTLALMAGLACLLIPGAYLLFGQGLWTQARRFAGAVVTGLGAFAALLPLALLTFSVQADQDKEAGAWMRVTEGTGGWQAGLVLENEIVLGFVGDKADAMRQDAPPPKADDAQAATEAPRLRQYFPETLYWAPEVVTDENGYVSLEIPMADSITTWRLTALASSQDGRLGYVTRGIRVFQDFFVDIDLPVALTQGDEISIPVGVFNYLPQAQEVRLVVEAEPWFELLGQGEQTLTIASNDIEVVYFPIRVLNPATGSGLGFGQRGFQVTAWGSQMSDAIRREVRVLPDGQEVRLSESDWLHESREIAVEIPTQAVPETSYVEFKVYPGVMAQVVEGLEKILRLPHG
jgi:5-hydroxyisourate hydrolase-like protein (transthyretin family)